MKRIDLCAALPLVLLLSAALPSLGCGPGGQGGEGGAALGEAEVAAEVPAAPAQAVAAGGSEVEVVEARVAPEFTLADLDGEVVRSADLRGKTVVIDFWATWCPPCEFQVPELNTFWKAHEADGDVVVLGVSVDVDTDEVVRDWADKKGVAYRVLLGGEELARRFGALGFPTLYVLAPDGTIVMDHVGLIEVADLETALEGLRAGS